MDIKDCFTMMLLFFLLFLALALFGDDLWQF